MWWELKSKGSIKRGTHRERERDVGKYLKDIHITKSSCWFEFMIVVDHYIVWCMMHFLIGTLKMRTGIKHMIRLEVNYHAKDYHIMKGDVRCTFCLTSTNSVIMLLEIKA